MAIYTLLQGQIAIFLLSAHTNTPAVAEVGALSRLGQLFTVIMMLNPFLVQPVFARVTSRRDFQTKLTLMVAALSALSALVLGSAYAAPHPWLFLLGSKYAGLTPELPIAVGTALATVVGGTLCTVVLARGQTRGQSFAILPCLGGQLAYIALRGVHSTSDGLILTFIPAMANAVTQAVLLLQVSRNWPETACRIQPDEQAGKRELELAQKRCDAVCNGGNSVACKRDELEAE
jgi:membrane-associated HD superfamily phosphohydrolase